MTATVIPLHTHRAARANGAAYAAALVARRLALTPQQTDALISKTRALVNAGCSAAFAVSAAHRHARKVARTEQHA